MRRRNSSQKGQIQHAFTFIMFILIAAIVLIMGYKGISGIFGGTCDLDKTSFREEISGYFERYNDFESVHKEKIKLPCASQEICFVDNSVYGNDVQLQSADPVIETAKEVKNNIFLVGDFTEPIGYSENVLVNGTDICIKARGGVVNLVFKGRGQGTLVEEG